MRESKRMSPYYWLIPIAVIIAIELMRPYAETTANSEPDCMPVKKVLSIYEIKQKACERYPSYERCD